MRKPVYVCETKDLPAGKTRLVPGVDRVDVLLVNRDGRYFAVTNICTHKGGPLSDGEIKGEYAICPWHKAHFRLDNGKQSWPALRAVRSYPVRVQGTSIYIDGEDWTHAQHP